MEETMKFGLDFKTARNQFFDRNWVKSRIDDGTRKALSLFGAYVRQTAKRSIRNRKGTSRPGRPPFSHTGLLRKHIYFGYDPVQRSVVIGPVSLFSRGKSGKAPEILEYGGKVTLPDGRRAKIKPRPFMGPAYEEELLTVSKLWRNAVR